MRSIWLCLAVLGVGLPCSLICGLTGCSNRDTSKPVAPSGSPAEKESGTTEDSPASAGVAQQPDGAATKQAATSTEQPPEDASAERDAQLRRLVVGTWEDDYKGHRTMTLNPDGTGIMIVELSGMQATLFASRLEFNMRWSLEDGRLKKKTIGGTPPNRVQLILKTMGDQVDEPILELTESRLLLLDKDGETRYDWRRKMKEADEQ